MIEKTEENPFQKMAINIEHEDERTPDPAELRVASKTDVKKLAGAIFAKFKEHGYVKLRCIGNGAIGSGFKGFTVARGYLIWQDVDPVATGAFFKVILSNGEERDGVVINIDPR